MTVIFQSRVFVRVAKGAHSHSGAIIRHSFVRAYTATTAVQTASNDLQLRDEYFMRAALEQAHKVRSIHNHSSPNI